MFPEQALSIADAADQPPHLYNFSRVPQEQSLIGLPCGKDPSPAVESDRLKARKLTSWLQ